MNTLIDQLANTSARFAEAKDISVARVSALVFGNGGKLPAVLYGNADVTTRSWERAMAWFSGNWPDGVEWPAGVPRPEIACSLPAEPPPSAGHSSADVPPPASAEALCREVME